MNITFSVLLVVLLCISGVTAVDQLPETTFEITSSKLNQWFYVDYTDPSTYLGVTGHGQDRKVALEMYSTAPDVSIEVRYIPNSTYNHDCDNSKYDVTTVTDQNASLMIDVPSDKYNVYNTGRACFRFNKPTTLYVTGVFAPFINTPTTYNYASERYFRHQYSPSPGNKSEIMRFAYRDCSPNDKPLKVSFHYGAATDEGKGCEESGVRVRWYRNGKYVAKEFYLRDLDKRTCQVELPRDPGAIHIMEIESFLSFGMSKVVWMHVEFEQQVVKWLHDPDLELTDNTAAKNNQYLTESRIGFVPHIGCRNFYRFDSTFYKENVSTDGDSGVAVVLADPVASGGISTYGHSWVNNVIAHNHLCTDASYTSFSACSRIFTSTLQGNSHGNAVIFDTLSSNYTQWNTVSFELDSKYGIAMTPSAQAQLDKYTTFATYELEVRMILLSDITMLNLQTPTYNFNNFNGTLGLSNLLPYHDQADEIYGFMVYNTGATNDSEKPHVIVHQNYQALVEGHHSSHGDVNASNFRFHPMVHPNVPIQYALYSVASQASKYDLATFNNLSVEIRKLIPVHYSSFLDRFYDGIIRPTNIHSTTDKYHLLFIIDKTQSWFTDSNKGIAFDFTWIDLDHENPLTGFNTPGVPTASQNCINPGVGCMDIMETKDGKFMVASESLSSNEVYRYEHVNEIILYVTVVPGAQNVSGIDMNNVGLRVRGTIESLIDTNPPPEDPDTPGDDNNGDDSGSGGNDDNHNGGGDDTNNGGNDNTGGDDTNHGGDGTDGGNDNNNGDNTDNGNTDGNKTPTGTNEANDAVEPTFVQQYGSIIGGIIIGFVIGAMLFMRNRKRPQQFVSLENIAMGGAGHMYMDTQQTLL